jgi:hypothetical protein
MKEGRGASKAAPAPQIELIWRNASLKGSSHQYRADVPLPSAGVCSDCVYTQKHMFKCTQKHIFKYTYICIYK